MSRIEVDNLYFRYLDQWILEKAHFTLSQRGLFALIGPNGSGKTTFLKLLLGLLNPTKGGVKIDNLSPQEARHLIGYVPQNISFDSAFPISALEVVEMGGLNRISHTKSKAEGLEKLRLLDIHHLADSPFGKLSGGQKQRVIFARALMCSPPILILDEPTSNVDSDSSQKIYTLLSQLKASTTILMVNHELSTILKHVDQVLVIQKSITTFTPKALCRHFTFGLYHDEEALGDQHPPAINDEETCE